MPPQKITSSSKHSLDTISAWALMGTIVAALFVVTPFIPVSFSVTKTFLLAAGTLITFALFILARLTRGNIVFPSSVLLGVLWLPVLAYAASAAFSGVSFLGALWGNSFEPDTLGFMAIAASLGTLSALVFRRPEQYRTFLKVGAWAFVAMVALEAIILLVGQFAPNVISPSFALIGSFSDLASFLGLGVVVLLITSRFLELSVRAHRILLAGGLIALFLLAVANSSLVWILVALVALGLFVEAVMRRGSKSADADLDETVMMEESPLENTEGGRSLVLPLSVLAVSLFFLVGGQLGGALAQSLNVNVLNIRPSWQATFDVAQKTYTTAPVFGSGPSTFGVEWLKHRSATLNSTLFWDIDFSSGIGFIPTAFVTTGIVGALAWIVFLGFFIVLGLRMLIVRAAQDPFVQYVAIVSFVSSLYLFVLALFDLPSTVILALAFVFAGIFISTTRYAAQGRQLGVLFSRSPRLGFVIVFSFTILLLSSVVAAYALVERSVATINFARATQALSGNDLVAADGYVQSAISFAPSADFYQMQARIAGARLAEIVASSTMEKTVAQKEYQNALSVGINAALTATNLNPSSYQNWLTLGGLYAQAVPLGVSGAFDGAKTAYTKAQELNPTNPQIPFILAQLHIANKDTKTAQEDLKAAIALKQDYTAAIFLLSQLEVQDGNVKDALSSALAAAYFAPNDPNVLFQVGILSAAAEDYTGAIAALSAAVSVNPSFANARYFLSAVYAKKGDMKSALEQMQAIAALSSDNAKAVETQIAALTDGRNPFPANLLTISPAPVQ